MAPIYFPMGTFSRGIFIRESKKERESTFILMGILMKECGRMTRRMERESIFTRIRMRSMWVSIEGERRREMEIISSVMEINL